MMKSYHSLFILFLFAGNVTAQTQLPNADLEHWTLAENGTDSLIGWSSSNSIVIPPVKSLYKESNAWEGKYAANIVTAPFGFIGYSTVGILANGEATFSYGGGGGGANVDYAGGGGTPLSQKPLALTGYYRSETLSPGDQPLAKIFLTATDALTGKRDTVGMGQWIFPASSSYTPFVIPIQDLQPGMDPDTILTLFYSSDPVEVDPFDVWSNLYLDSLNLVYPTTSTHPAFSDNHLYRIVPNPCSEEFTVFHPAGSRGILQMYSVTGQLIHSQEVLNDVDRTKILIPEGPNGQYIVRVTQNDICSIMRVQVFH